MRVGLYGLPPRVTLEALPSTATTLAANFDGMAQLIGYDAQTQGDHLIVDWYWRGSGQVDQPYVVFQSSAERIAMTSSLSKTIDTARPAVDDVLAARRNLSRSAGARCEA